jgi:hypothetical protein
MGGDSMPLFGTYAMAEADSLRRVADIPGILLYNVVHEDPGL